MSSRNTTICCGSLGILNNTVDKWVKTFRNSKKVVACGFQWVVYWCQWVIVVSKQVAIKKTKTTAN